MIITQSPKIKELIKFAKVAAQSSAPVLLRGESGTGKELFAQMIHRHSPRSKSPLVALNCAALPESLLESELFGHEKGAFSGAVNTRVGRFELANEGTLLLDEVSEVPIAAQAKLLRVLESKTFERVGSSDSIEHDVRIVAASNRDLIEEIEAGTFRLDLYHRINVIEILIPPLRDRVGDIPLLAMHFIEQFRSESRVPIEGFDSAAMRALAKHDWPGNVRELRNVIHRACVLSEQTRIATEDLRLCQGIEKPADGKESAEGSNSQPCLPEQSPPEQSPPEQSPPEQCLPEHWLHTHLDEVERQIIIAAIDRFGSRKIVAEKLGVSPRTLTNKIKRYRQLEQGASKAA